MTNLSMSHPMADWITLAFIITCMGFSTAVILMELIVANAMRRVLREADAQRLAERIVKTASRKLEG